MPLATDHQPTARWRQTLTRWGAALLRPRSYRVQLTLSFVLVALIPLVVMIGYQAYVLDRARLKEIEKQQTLTHQIASELRAFVEMHRRGIETAAFQVTQTGARDKATFDAILESLQRQFPGFINLYFANQYGVTQAFYPERNPQGHSMVGANFSMRWHYKKLLAAPQTYISPVMKGVGGTDKLLCTIVSPYFDKTPPDLTSNPQNEAAISSTAGTPLFAGFVLGALNLEKIGDLITHLLPHEKVYVFVTDPLGQGIYTPVGLPTTGPEQVALNVALDESGRTTTHQHVLPLINEEVYTTSALIEELHWRVYVSVPVAEQNALLTSLVHSGIVLLGLTLTVLLLVSRGISQKLSAAIDALVKKSTLIKTQAFTESAAVTLPNRAPKETQLLARTFDVMAQSIASSHEALSRVNQELESRVAIRTAFLRAILRSLADPFCIVDGGEITLTNAALRDWLHLPDNTNSASPSLTVDGLLQAIAQSTQEGIEELTPLLTAPGEAILKNRAGTRYWLCTSFWVEGITPTRERYGLGLIFRDVSRERRLDQLKDSLIAIAAHEFKTPVASLKIQAETLARDDIQWSPEDIQDMIAGILEDTGRLELLIKDWLDISKLDSGNLPLRHDAVSLRAVIQSAISLVQKTSPTLTVEWQQSAEKGAASTATVPTEPIVMGDASRLQQILVNLLSNAVRYCDRVPHVTLSLAATSTQWQLAIEDNGIGIPDEELERVFERFHQVDGSSTRRAGGTGLGLSIARGLAKAHGGDITVVSTVGVGSTFTLWLPRRPTTLDSSPLPLGEHDDETLA